MRPVRRIKGPRTLAEQAEHEIQTAILEGEFAAGERLTIDELARGFELSPMPVRDALRRLASTGFVEYVPHRGATVAALSIEDLRDTWDARLALEAMAIRRAAERFTETDGQVVEAAIMRHRSNLLSNDHVQARVAHRDIHLGLYGPSQYNWLERLVEPIWARSERYRSFALGDRGTVEQLVDEHRSILDACIQHDPDAAAERLYAHLAQTANIVAEKLGGVPLFDHTAPPWLGRVATPVPAAV